MVADNALLKVIPIHAIHVFAMPVLSDTENHLKFVIPFLNITAERFYYGVHVYWRYVLDSVAFDT